MSISRDELRALVREVVREAVRDVRATAKTPGNSAASPEGRAAIAAAKQQAEQEQQQAAADQAKPKH